MDSTIIYCAIGAVIVGAASVIATSVRIVQEYERLVVFRLGRSIGVKGPGLILLFPFIDRGVRVDLREQKRDIH